MSGIEAVFGAVASGAGLISFSVQLAESAMKLKRIYDAAKDAPRAISDISEDLDTMAMTLQQLEEHHQPGSSTEALLARCIARCKRCAAEIQRLVNKMEDSTKRHPKTGRLYSAFKQRDVKELLDSLDRAKTSLELAHMIYRAEQRDQQHADVLAIYGEIMTGYAGRPQLTLLHQHSSWPRRSAYQTIPGSHNTPAIDMTYVPVDEESSESAQLDVSTRRGPTVRRKGRRGNAKPYFRGSIRLPTWFSQRVFGFALTQAQWGWNLQLHTYNLVPFNSPIFKYCCNGNLAGVRRLFDSGMASPLDVGGMSWTLLDEAACHEHIDICRYLLSNSTWPDRTALMSNALSWYALDGFRSRERRPAQMYRLFLTDPDFDPSLEDALESQSWAQWCADNESLEVILQNQPLDFNIQPLAFRFEMALSFYRMDTLGFLKCIGLHASDGRLASIRNSDGNTVLHVVARWINRLSYPGQPSNQLQQWVALGVDVLRNGANPSSIKNTINQQQITWRSTPLMDCLGVDIGWSLYSWSLEQLQRVLNSLHVWAEMLQEADLDLFACGAAECEIWKSLRAHDCSKSENEAGIKLVQLVYGPTPAEWSLRTSLFWTVDVYALRPPPGAFNDELRVPVNINWMPTNQETDEGPWTLVERKTRMEPVALISSRPCPVEGFIELVDSTQDDTGVITLMQHRASRAPRASLRSHSQPPCLRRRDVAYYGVHEASTHPWLPEYHLCPFDSSWRFGCVGGCFPRSLTENYQRYHVFADNVERRVSHVRSCVKGIVSSRISTQESYRWQNWSFLAEIADCQDGPSLTKGARGMRHTGTRDCSQGCGNIFLNKMKVPEALRAFHPTPRYGGPEEDYDDDVND